MKQLISVLVAAVFAAVSVAAIAQDKKADGDKGTKTKTSQTKAQSGDKKPAKQAAKPSKGTKTKTQKKGEDTKK